MTNETDKTEPSESKADDLAMETMTESELADEVLGELDSAPEAVDETTELRGKLATAEQEILRGRAEMENLRKRMQRDTDMQVKFANVPLVRDLLDVIDNLNRAAESARGDDANVKALRDGVQMVSQQFTQVLVKHGCKAIEATGADFDPNFHQAIAQMPSSEFGAGKVAMEVAVGYMLHDRVIRPAQVMVSTGPAAEPTT